MRHPQLRFVGTVNSFLMLKIDNTYGIVITLFLHHKTMWQLYTPPGIYTLKLRILSTDYILCFFMILRTERGYVLKQYEENL